MLLEAEQARRVVHQHVRVEHEQLADLGAGGGGAAGGLVGAGGLALGEGENLGGGGAQLAFDHGPLAFRRGEQDSDDSRSMLAGRGGGHKPLRRGLRAGEELVVETAQAPQAGGARLRAPVARMGVRARGECAATAPTNGRIAQDARRDGRALRGADNRVSVTPFPAPVPCRSSPPPSPSSPHSPARPVARAADEPILVGQSVTTSGASAEHGQRVVQGARLVLRRGQRVRRDPGPPPRAREPRRRRGREACRRECEAADRARRRGRALRRGRGRSLRGAAQGGRGAQRARSWAASPAPPRCASRSTGTAFRSVRRTWSSSPSCSTSPGPTASSASRSTTRTPTPDDGTSPTCASSPKRAASTWCRWSPPGASPRRSSLAR